MCEHLNSFLSVTPDSKETLSIQDDFSSVDKIKRDQKMRIHELIDTEKKYVSQLRHVVRHYIPSLKEERVPHELSLLQPNDVFCNIKQIYKFHARTLLPELITASQNVNDLGDTFINNVDALIILYESYSNKTKKSFEVIEKHWKFFERKQDDCNDDFDILTYISYPLQRITRYPIFLENIIKNYRKEIDNEILKPFNPGHPLSKADTDKVLHTLSVAHQKMVNLLITINTKMTLQKLQNIPINLEEQGRYLRHNEFTVTDNLNHQHKMKCFLFEKVLIFTVLLNPKDPINDVYKYYDSIPIDYLAITAPVDEESNIFEVCYHKNDSRRYILEGEITITKNWIYDINQILWNQLISHKEESPNNQQYLLIPPHL